MKICSKCGKSLPLSDFHKDKQKADGYYSSCKSCHSKRNFPPQRDLNKKCHKCGIVKSGKEFARSRAREDGLQVYCKECRRAMDLERLYGCTINEYEKRLESQSGVCAICSKESGRNLAVDHCHNTSNIRGLLCDRCNQGLGYFNDNPQILRAAAQYLERNSNG